MFGFLVKKAFFDMWDNLFRVVVMNIGYVLIGGAFLGVLELSAATTPWGLLALLPCMALLFVYTGAVSGMTKEIADYGTPGLRDFWTHVKESAPTSLLFALIVNAHLFILRYTAVFYLGLGTMLGLVALAFIFWVSVLWALSCLYFYPVQSRLDRDFRKIVRKMMVLFFDNTVFSLGLALGALVVIVLSAFTAFLLPGFATVLVWVNVSLKLRLYKYDYLEQHPEANRRQIPWDALLVDDRERVGKRTIRGMIFPWKE
jgi:hypothetical protein